MKLVNTQEFDPRAEDEVFFERFEHRPAVFLLFSDSNAAPYIGRTRNLQRRLRRILRRPEGNSKLLNLREITRRIDYQYAGSSFEMQWMVYHLNRQYYPRQYRARMRLRPPALLKLNLRNRFPRLYPTRRISRDGSIYYGPFPSRAATERFAGEFLDLFKIRRCVEDLDPNPAHPGCIYSQMRMCLAPCFKGCTDEEYRKEVARVIEFLASDGESLVKGLKSERDRASADLDFERAAQLHRKVEKVHEALALKPEPVQKLDELHAVLVLPGAQPKTAAFFLMCSGKLRGPVSLDLDENVPSPLSLDERFRRLFENLLNQSENARAANPWEHLSLFTKWYYSSFRQGEIVMLASPTQIPYAKLIRICRKIIASSG
ncbi:MAG TPA: UvrB/UvrC motif-containing protein [Terriglobia bacterium]|jgi:excinuclease UvrABC nuclease subunit|nr:UvrB/UvrC motif-containing protein [Terriglobia bacterium]